MNVYPRVQPPAPVDVIHLIPELLQSLIALLSELTEREWAAPTVCSGWTVKDVALHLLGVDVGNLSVRRDGFSDPWWETSGDDPVVALDRFNENWVVSARRLSPRLLVELLTLTGSAVSSYFSGLDLTAFGEPVSWASPEPAPAWLDVAREYTERWVHQQQIQEAVGRPGLTEPRYLAPVLATFVHALPHALRTTPAPAGTVVRLRIAGEAGGAWLSVRTRDGWVLGVDSGGTAAATVTIDQDTAWRLWTKGLSRTAAREHVRIEGSVDLGEKVLDMVSIIG